MADHGLKASTTGTSVLTQIDKDILYTSKFNSLKINSTGLATVTTNGSGNGTTVVAHNLGYTPAHLVFRKCTTSFSFLGTTTYPNSYVPDPGVYNGWAGTVNTQLSSYADGTNLTFLASSAEASSSYIFRYYTLVDLSKTYSGTANPTLSSDYGWKVSKPGIDVKTAREYQLSYSTRYKALQYYSVNYATQNVTLPKMFCSLVDNPVEEATYVDIQHGLGYPPLFLSFFQGTALAASTISTMIPYTGVNNGENPDYGVWSFCDSERIRISFWRKSYLLAGQPIENWSAETIKIQCYVFTEDLS